MKIQVCRFHQEPVVSASTAIAQATCHSSDPSPITPVLGPQSRANAVTFEPGSSKWGRPVHKKHLPAVWIWLKPDGVTKSTVQFVRKNNNHLKVYFCNFFNQGKQHQKKSWLSETRVSGRAVEEPLCWWEEGQKEYSPCWWNWAELRHHLSSWWLLGCCGPGSHIKPQPSLLELRPPRGQPVAAKQNQKKLM